MSQKRCWLLLLLCLTPAAAQAAAPRRPNVIIVLSDDQGYGDFSCHGNPGAQDAEPRPAARSGRPADRFSRRADVYADARPVDDRPGCSAQRRVVGLRGPLVHPPRHPDHGRHLSPPAAIAPAHFGKWHLGDSYPEPAAAARLSGVGLSPRLGHHFDGRRLAERLLRRPLSPQRRAASSIRAIAPTSGSTWRWTGSASSRRQGEPFFVYLPTNAAHGPLWVADKYKEPYKGRGPAGFFGMIANLDENMGRLDALLDETGLADNTIVIYLNDNGGTAGVRLQRRHARQKTHLLRRRTSRRLLHSLAGGRLRAPATSTR